MSVRDRLATTGKRFYCVCFSYRSGSTLLRDDLHQWGLGAPNEYFQLPTPLVEDASVADYVVRVVEQTPESVFGFKISWEQVSALIQRLRVEGDADASFDLRSIFPSVRHLHLVRRDKVAQAVSLWRAIRSNQWHWEVGTEVDRGYPTYDFSAIKDYLLQVIAEEWLWESHLSNLGIDRHQIAYEDYIENRLSTLASVADYLGETVTPTLPIDHIQIMRDEWSERTIEQVWADLRASAHLGHALFIQNPGAHIAATTRNW